METAELKTADGRWVARRLYLARSFSERLRGVMKIGPLLPDTALMISPCASIHTFALGFPIDAIFLNGQLRILRLASHIRPWRIRRGPAGTRHVVELPAGTLELLNLDLGAFICVHPATDERPCAGRRRTACSTAHVRFSIRIPDDAVRGDRDQLSARGRSACSPWLQGRSR